MQNRQGWRQGGTGWRYGWRSKRDLPAQAELSLCTLVTDSSSPSAQIPSPPEGAVCPTSTKKDNGTRAVRVQWASTEKHGVLQGASQWATRGYSLLSLRSGGTTPRTGLINS